MLQRNKQLNAERPEREAGAPSLEATLGTLADIARRQFPVLILVVTAALLCGGLYLLTTPPRYTATATMVIDTRKVQLFQQQSIMGDIPIDAGTVQTQLEVLKSQNVSLAVIRDLHLADDPEFVAPRSGLLGALLGAVTSRFGAAEPLSEAQRQRRALGVFEAGRSVSRVGLTYVMEIGFTSLDPDKAARIANAIADAYITDQLDAKYQATRRASLWLQDRIKELRTQASTAERAVVDFKQENNINTVDPTGKSMNEQQMSEVNSQLIMAHAATAEAKARLDRINDILKDAIPDASVADALKSEVIIKLRSQYLDLAGREAILASKYGANHQAAIGLRNQMQEIRRNISDEMQKIAESYKSDYAIAATREESIRSSLQDSVSEAQSSNQAQIQLRELQSTSQSYRSMYDSFLQRYMESVQQQSFPITEARLIGPAERPAARSQPKTTLVLAATLLAGLLVSFGVATLREMADRVFRTTRQVEDRLQLDCLALLPAVRLKAAGEPGSVADPQGRRLATTPGMWRVSVNEPFSRFTEALRSVKVAADLANATAHNKVIGVTSTLPNEGKSTTSINFAHLIAHSGSRVLLVDADLRNPSLSRGLARDAEAGFVDVVAGRKTLDEVVWTDPVSQLSFLPAGGQAKLLHTNEILASDGMRQVFADWRARFDYIVVDFAPLAPVVDTRTTTAFIDSYVYVVEWGRTRFDIVEHSLSSAREIHDRVLGVVLNKADMGVLGRYERYRSNAYYRKYYSRYGYTA